MDALGARWGAAISQRARDADWAGIAIWALAFGLLAYLGLEGGGFDPLVRDPVGIAVWWVLLAGVAIGALPRRRPAPLAWGALGLLAAFAAWTGLSLGWTETPDKSWGEVARVAGYLGVFALALFARGRRGARRLVGAVGAAVSLVAAVALLSRLQPGWFPGAAETGEFLSRERLSFPLNYWNALAALIAIGAPAVLHVATGARSALARGMAAAALPALALTAFYTLGRGGIAAGLIALAVFLLLTSDRLPRLASLLLAAGGGAVLIAAAAGRGALREGLAGPLAQEQGDEMLTLVLVVCGAVGVAQAALSSLLRGRSRPRWTAVPPRAARVGAVAGAVALLVAGLALDAPGRAADAWEEFKAGDSPGQGIERLGSAAGLHRYDFWVAAVEQSETGPLSGTGAGSFEYWWAREGEVGGTIRDAHSLYAQTLGELGIVGFALLVGFFAVVLVGGGRQLARAGARGRPQLAAALAGCVAFLLTAGFDWHWQIPALPVAFLLLAAALVGSGPRRSSREEDEGDGEGAVGRRLPEPALRAGFSLVAIAAIVAIAVPLASTSLLRQSEAEAREGDLAAALADARSARNALPGAAGPRLQEALVLELMGRPGEAAAAIRAYRRARSLNPHHSLFD